MGREWRGCILCFSLGDGKKEILGIVFYLFGREEGEQRGLDEMRRGRDSESDVDGWRRISASYLSSSSIRPQRLQTKEVAPHFSPSFLRLPHSERIRSKESQEQISHTQR